MENYPVGPGWWPLLNKYLPPIRELGGKLNRPPYVKYGLLALDVEPATEEIAILTELAELESGSVCESCGAAGELRDTDLWQKTLCSRCFSKRMRSTPRTETPV